MKIAGWGRFPKADCDVQIPRDEAELTAALSAGPAIARGNGRAYGDSSLNPDNTIDMRRFDRMVAFDEERGQLVAEAGVLLGDIIDAFLPRGWFPSVTPGTKFVTLGGMIAANVHGKNHHVDGGMINCVDWIDVMAPDGSVTRASADDNSELFFWSVGGMGLTGVILRAAIRLRKVETGWIKQKTRAAKDLNAAMEIFETTAEAPYSVAWIDCQAQGDALGRSLVMLGEHAGVNNLPTKYRRVPFGPPPKQKLNVPFNAPSFALNRYTVRAFNTLYYHVGARKTGTSYVAWDKYFYPLDGILGWNKIYGRRGFVQFQCVLPEESARAGLTDLLGTIAEAGQGSFLAVLKKMGQDNGYFAFPMPGYTLALDFPVSETVLTLMSELDQITLQHDGRFYLAKDARMSADTMRASDARATPFAAYRQTSGVSDAFSSLQSERLKL